MKKMSILAHFVLVLTAAVFLAACADMQMRDSGGYNSYGGHSGHGGHH